MSRLGGRTECGSAGAGAGEALQGGNLWSVVTRAACHQCLCPSLHPLESATLTKHISAHPLRTGLSPGLPWAEPMPIRVQRTSIGVLWGCLGPTVRPYPIRGRPTPSRKGCPVLTLVACPLTPVACAPAGGTRSPSSTPNAIAPPPPPPPARPYWTDRGKDEDFLGPRPVTDKAKLPQLNGYGARRRSTIGHRLPCGGQDIT